MKNLAGKWLEVAVGHGWPRELTKHVVSPAAALMRLALLVHSV